MRRNHTDAHDSYNDPVDEPGGDDDAEFPTNLDDSSESEEAEAGRNNVV
jgi:hypothetical protein